MAAAVALVRQALAELPQVSDTWFEWTFDGTRQLKTLVIEVNFDTDPSSPGFSQPALDHIRGVLLDVLTNRTTMVVHGVRIVPKAA
jgi:hypothetical protein